LENEEKSRSAKELEDEAKALRQHLSEKSQILEPTALSLWKKALLSILLVGSVSAAVLLLIFDRGRQDLLAGLSESWLGAYSGPGTDIIALPPPPPKEVEPRIRYPDTFSSSGGGFGDEFDGVLYASSSGRPGGGDDEETEEEPAFVNPAKTDESKEAFVFLTQNSEIARQLTEGSASEYEFKEWKPVRVDPPLFFIDLLVTRKSDSRELHLVWEVDLEEASVRALSQAARDLETKGKE
jgi:hypothetical protein